MEPGHAPRRRPGGNGKARPCRKLRPRHVRSARGTSEYYHRPGRADVLLAVMIVIEVAVLAWGMAAAYQWGYDAGLAMRG